MSTFDIIAHLPYSHINCLLRQNIVRNLELARWNGIDEQDEIMVGLRFALNAIDATLRAA